MVTINASYITVVAVMLTTLEVKFLKNVLVLHASLITSGKRHKVIIYSFVNQNYLNEPDLSKDSP